MTIIYIIKNRINFCVYIGQTKQTLNQRLQHHFSCAACNYNSLFYRAIREIGKENFYIEPIDYVEDYQADQRELDWIIYYDSFLPVYNTKFSLGKCGGDTLSNHPKRELIGKKISEKVKGSNNSQASPIIAYHVLNGGILHFGSISECQSALNIPRHDIISRRCKGKIKKPYGNIMFEYDNK